MRVVSKLSGGGFKEAAEGWERAGLGLDLQGL